MTLSYDFERNTGHWVSLTARAIEQAINARLARHGITHRQMQVIGSIVLKKEISQSDVAEMIGIEPSTLVRILDRMERDGWVARKSAPDDRRKKLIRATEKTKPVWDTIVRTGEEVMQQATQGLSDRQLKEVRKALATMHSNLMALP